MPTKAVEKLNFQLGNFKDPTAYERGSEGVDLTGFLLDVTRDAGLDIDVAASITDGYIERTMDGASALQAAVHDPRSELINSGIFGDGTFQRIDVLSPWRNSNPNKPQFQAIDVLLDGLWFRLVQVQKQTKDLTLTFQDRNVSYLESHNRPRRVSRSHTTRAKFAKMMVDEVKAGGGMNFYSPELDVKQPTARIEKPTDSLRRHKRQKGLLNTVNLAVKGTRANKDQLSNAQDILDTGAALGANRKCMVASIMTAIQEADLINDPGGDGTSIGLFQQTAGGAWGSAADRHDPIKASEMFFKACIAADKQNPSLSLNDLCQTVQRSAFPNAYGQWAAEGKRFVAQYTGGGSGGSGGGSTSFYYKEYDYHRGPPDGPHGENTWQATKRLADEVGWRRFVVGNTFFFIQDSDLMSAKPIAVISEDDEGIDHIDFDIDQNKPVSEATVYCRASRWFARPGELIEIDGLGPANTRWLVWTVHRDLFSENTEVTLRIPEAAKPEPAPELVTSSSGPDSSGIATGGLVHAKGIRDAIVKAGQLAASYGPSKYTYQEVRPIPASLFQGGMIVTDCSGFATLCYKAAGAADPNGFAYNGQGNTGSLMASSVGKQIGSKDLQPGDLVFYRSPEHVAVWIGDGQSNVVEFGGQGGPRVVNVNYRNDIIGFWTYNLRAVENGHRPPPPAQQVVQRAAQSVGSGVKGGLRF